MTGMWGTRSTLGPVPLTYTSLYTHRGGTFSPPASLGKEGKDEMCVCVGGPLFGWFGEDGMGVG